MESEEKYPYVYPVYEFIGVNDNPIFDGTCTVTFLHEVEIVKGSHVCGLPMVGKGIPPGLDSLAKCSCGRYYRVEAPFGIRHWQNISGYTARRHLKKVAKR